MPPIRSTIEYLFGLEKFGIKLGLHNIRVLLETLGNPQTKFLSVHIAGTNGKGSTSSMIAAVLTTAGYKVGLYTSPHLVKFNERIRINGRMISDADLIRYTRLLRPKIDTLRATFFEATTAIAFKYFADRHIDIGVIETGLGGRLDATNVLVPAVSVITTIGKDHVEHLGHTFRDIAFEKGGIIKPGVPCVVGVRNPSALRELRSIALRRHSQFIEVGKQEEDASSRKRGSSVTLTVQTPKTMYKNLRIPLSGEFQLQNAAVALAGLEQLSSCGVSIEPGAVKRGFANIRMLTGIRARFETLRKRPRIVLDVGHNVDGISATVSSMKRIKYQKLSVVFGVMKDKDVLGMIRALSVLKPRVFAFQPAMERAMPPDGIVKLFRRMRCVAQAFPDAKSALDNALRSLHSDDVLLICGSHYVAGEVLRVMEGELVPKSS